MKRRVAVVVVGAMALIGAPALIPEASADVSVPSKAPLCLGVPGIDLGYCLKVPNIPKIPQL